MSWWGEDISLHTYIRARKKQTQYTISQIQDTDGNIYKTTRDNENRNHIFTREI